MKFKAIVFIGILALIAFLCSAQEEVDMNLNGIFKSEDDVLFFVTHIDNLVYYHSEIPEQAMQALGEDVTMDMRSHVFQGFAAAARQQQEEEQQEEEQQDEEQQEEDAQQQQDEILISGTFAYVPKYLESDQEIEQWNQDLQNKFGIISFTASDEDTLMIQRIGGEFLLEEGATLTRISADEARQLLEGEEVEEEQPEEEQPEEEQVEDEQVQQ